MVKVKHADHDKKYRKLAVAIIVIFTVIPTIMFYSGFMGISFFFPTYFVVSVVYALLSIYFLFKFTHLYTLPKWLVIVALIVKLLIAQVIFIYLFTPLLDYTIFSFTLAKMCGSANFWGQLGSSSLTTACQQIFSQIGY